MSTYLWLIALIAMLGSGACAGLTSCWREQGDQEKAQTFSWMAVGLFAVAVIAAGAAWSTS